MKLIRIFLNWLLGLFGGPILPKELDDEECQCTHLRCKHTKGIGKCHQIVMEGVCTCQIFVKRSPPISPPEPTPEDLDKLEYLEKI